MTAEKMTDIIMEVIKNYEPDELIEALRIRDYDGIESNVGDIVESIADDLEE